MSNKRGCRTLHSQFIILFYSGYSRQRYGYLNVTGYLVSNQAESISRETI